MINENQLNEILDGFTGDVKKDIDYFLSVREKYRNTPDDNIIFNKCLQVLVEEMNDEQKQQFFDGMKEMGLDKYIKPVKTVKLGTVSKEEAVKIKEIIINGGEGVEQRPFDFEVAKISGKQFTVSVPSELVEQLKKNRAIYLKSLKEKDGE